MSAPLHYAYYLVVAHPDAPRLLLLPGAHGWRLPGFGGDEPRFWQDVDHVNTALRATLGLDAVTLRCLRIDYRREEELVSKYYLAAPRQRGWAPPADARWVGAAELEDLALSDEAQRLVLGSWFAWQGDEPAPSTRSPWYRRGWFERAATWAAERLVEAGLTPTGPAEQLRSWQRSAILRLPTATGPAYFKAVPPMFGHEPALTAALAAAHPGQIAEPVAIDPARGWLLMRELPGPGLHTLVGEVERWEAALAQFAELQISTIGRLDALRAIGVPQRPLAALADDLDALLAAMAGSAPESPDGLTTADRRQLRTLGPWLRARIDELESYGLPLVLEHGDFWPGQVVVGEAGFGFLDWSDSALAHPFFSLLLFLVELDDFFPRSPGVRERLRNAYLAPWATAFPGLDLVRAFEIAQPLAAIHHARTYHQVVLPNMELQWEMELMLPFYLKLALRYAG